MYFCKICGRQLEKEGDICIDCYEGLIEEEDNDEVLFTMRAKFNFKYEIMKSPFVFFLILLLFIVSTYTGFKTSILTGIMHLFVFSTVSFLYFFIKKIRIESREIKLYNNKLIYNRKLHLKKMYEVSYKDILEIQFEDLNKKTSIIAQSSWWLTTINKKFKMSELFFRLKKTDNSLLSFGFYFRPIYNFEEEAMPKLMQIMGFEKREEEKRTPLEEMLNIKKNENKKEDNKKNKVNNKAKEKSKTNIKNRKTNNK